MAVLRIPTTSCQPLHVLYHGLLYPPSHHVSLDLDRKLPLKPVVPLRDLESHFGSYDHAYPSPNHLTELQSVLNHVGDVLLHLLFQLIRVALQELFLFVFNIQIQLSLHRLDSLHLQRIKVVFPLWLGGDQRRTVDVAWDEILLPPPTTRLESVVFSGLDGLLELWDERGLILYRQSFVMYDLLHREALILLKE